MQIYASQKIPQNKSVLLEEDAKRIMSENPVSWNTGRLLHMDITHPIDKSKTNQAWTSKEHPEAKL